MAMMKTWNDQGFVMKCLKKMATTPQRTKMTKIYLKIRRKKAGKNKINTV